MCECAACGQIFTSLTAFDQHQDVNYKRKPAVICRCPTEVGLVQGSDGRWRVPLSAAGAERLKNLRAERAKAGRQQPGPDELARHSDGRRRAGRLKEGC